jgi:hypothetical protein
LQTLLGCSAKEADHHSGLLPKYSNMDWFWLLYTQLLGRNKQGSYLQQSLLVTHVNNFLAPSQ